MSRIDACAHIEAGRDAGRADDDERLEHVVDRLEMPASRSAVIGRDEDRRARTGGGHEVGQQGVDACRGGEVLLASPSDGVTGEVCADEVGECDVGSVAVKHVDRLAGDDVVVVRVVATVETDAVLRGVRLDE